MVMSLDSQLFEAVVYADAAKAGEILDAMKANGTQPSRFRQIYSPFISNYLQESRESNQNRAISANAFGHALVRAYNARTWGPSVPEAVARREAVVDEFLKRGFTVDIKSPLHEAFVMELDRFKGRDNIRVMTKQVEAHTPKGQNKAPAQAPKPTLRA